MPPAEIITSTVQEELGVEVLLVGDRQHEIQAACRNKLI